MTSRTDLLIKVEENGEIITIPRALDAGQTCLLMGYSFYDTVPNVRNFSIEVNSVSIAIEDGNYSYNEFVFALNTALTGAGLSEVDTDAKNGSILFSEPTEALNEDTARLLNMDANVANSAGFNTGVLPLGGNRIFYVEFSSISSYMMTDGKSGFFKILNNDGGAFNHIAGSNFSNPQMGETIGTLSQVKVSIYDEQFRAITINKGAPAYFNIFCYKKHNCY